LKEQGKLDANGKGKASFLGINIGAGLKTVREKSSDWLSTSKSLNDQVKMDLVLITMKYETK
jgi:hypothetical protein